jgi:hypothetical protein
MATSYSRAKKNVFLRHGWTMPKEDFVKLSVDVGLDTCTGSTGAILWDERGHFLAASCRGIPV